MIPRNKRTGSIKQFNVPIAKILTKPRQEWFRFAKNNGRTASADIDWRKYNPNDFLFTQCTIVSSCDTEADGHTIKKSSEHLVNANGNAWTNPVLLATFRTFIGGENYKEHVQVKSLSYGKILDAVIRPFRYKKGDEVSDVFICDILVATERKHTLLCQDIESGKLKTLSMGTVCSYVGCSQCGKYFTDEEEQCEHIKDNLGGYYFDSKGVKRIVAELCGRSIFNPKTGLWEGDPDSNKFIEASWVWIPAYGGAVINHFVNPEDVGDKIDNMFLASLENAVSTHVADKSFKIARQILRQEQARQSREKMIDKIIRS
jgi:hypothetical protein